jgi:hypothetical protein
MWHLILKLFKTRFKISCWFLLQNCSNYHFYFKYAWAMLYAYSNLLFALSKYSRSNMSINPLFLLDNLWRGRSFWLIPSLAHIFLALTTSWRRQVFLYAHSKCVRGCSMRIQNMARAALFYYVGT